LPAFDGFAPPSSFNGLDHNNNRRHVIMIAKKVIASALALSLAASALPIAASAAPIGPSAAGASDKSTTLVENVHRRGRHHHHRRGGGGGRGAAALVGGIIAGAIIAGAISEGRASDGDVERCEDEFRSFNPRTGTYITYEGDEVVCPYLR
jgi:hypothetical protein